MKKHKKFRILDLKRFLKREPVENPRKINTSRRRALRNMSLFAFGINPLVRTIDRTLLMPFAVRQRGRALCFYYDDHLAWEIDPDRFGSRATLDFSESDDGFTILLKNAEYPSTGVSADFNASLTRPFGSWQMDISFPGLNISEKVPFSRWLRGERELQGELGRSLVFSMGEHDSLSIPAPATLSLSRSWDLRIYPRKGITLNIFEGEEHYGSAGISLPGDAVPGWISRGFCKEASCITLHDAQSRFSSLGNLRFLSRPAFTTASYPFTRTGVVIGRSAKGPAAVLWACNDNTGGNGVPYTLPGNGDLTLSFYQSRFFREYTPKAGPFVFVAALGDTPQWIGTAGSSFALASTADYSLCIQGEGLEITGSDLKAALVKTRIRVAGASSLPVDYPGRQEVSILPQDPFILRPQTVQPGQIRNPLNIRILDDQDDPVNWIYLNRVATEVRFRTDRSIFFNLIRANDFLSLQLEYINFTLDGSILRIDSQRSPAFLIVHFPSQHTRERMFRLDDQISVPVEFFRAGSSRLVFRVPADSRPIPLTLDHLLNWDNFEIQVNYRARWFNTGRIVGGLLLESLKKLSMVFSAVPRIREPFVRSPAINLQTRPLRVIDPAPVPAKQLQQPLSAQELKIALSTTPGGVGRMGLSEEGLNTVVAHPGIETTSPDLVTGAMQLLFRMGPPSKYETSIEAPVWTEISPNQFAGFTHNISLRDEFGEYDEEQVEGLDISDDPAEEPVRRVAPAMIERPGEIRRVQPVRVEPEKEKQEAGPGQDRVKIQPAVLAAPQRRNYKAIVSPSLLQIHPGLLIRQGQLFELWHTRMGIKLASGEVDEDNLNELKTVRVLWSPCANEKLSQKYKPVTDPKKSFYSLPEPPDLHDMVHLTSNYNELRLESSGVKADPLPVRAKRLMLSGLGAWFDYEFRDDREIVDIGLQAWLQRATMGRDHYIKLVTRGYLFPFGHKAVHVRIGERKVQLVKDVYTAVVIVKEFIIVKQPELYYDNRGQNQGFIPFAFQRVEIKDIEKQIVTRQIITSQEIFELYEVTDPDKPSFFRIELDDAAGRKVRMEVPLVFAESRIDDQSVIANHYSGEGWDYFSSTPASIPVSYARSLVPGDTSFETKSIIFGARNLSYDLDGVEFYPEIIEATVFVKQMEELTGERKGVRIQLVDDDNLSMVFARVHPDDKAELVFGDTETSGGFLTPNMAVTGFSSLTGLTGNEIANLDILIVAAEKIFTIAGRMPRIFGIINFVDILLPDFNLTEAVNKIKDQIGQIRNQIETCMQNILKLMARADTEFKKMDRLFTAIGGLLDNMGMLDALKDPAGFAQALGSYGITVPQGTLPDAVNAAVTVGREIQAKGIEPATLTGYMNNPSGLRTELTNAGADVSQQVVSGMLQLVTGLHNDGFEDREIIAIVNGLGLAGGVTDLQGLVKTLAGSITSLINESIPEIPNVKFHIKGDEVVVEYHWKPGTKNEYGTSLFEIKNLDSDTSRIDVSVDSILRKSIDLKTPPVFNVDASIKKFTIIIANTLQINFERISFKSSTGSKPDTDVRFMTVPVRLTGSLSFVNSLQKVISSDQFAAGPYIDVSSTGLVAGYNFPLPNIEVGILALSNMMLGTRLNLPFNSDPLTLGFNFSSRENPFKVLVSCFGGGGFFSLETTMSGLTRLDAAFEFGAGISLDVGVASGSVEAMGGIYYCMVAEAGGNSYTLSAYLRITGRLSILKLIRITLEFYLEMLYESVGGQKAITEGGETIMTVDSGSRLVGTASLSVKVEVLFFSKTVKVTVKRTFAGNDADPKFAETYNLEHWQDYCAAFAS